MRRIALVCVFFLFFGGTTQKRKTMPTEVKIAPEIELSSSLDKLAVGSSAMKKSVEQSKN